MMIFRREIKHSALPFYCRAPRKFKYKCKRENLKNHSKLAFWLVGSARIAKKSAAFNKYLMQIRHHASGISKPVSLRKEIVYHLFVMFRPELLCSAACVKLAFFIKMQSLYEVKSVVFCQSVQRDFIFISKDYLYSGSVNDIYTSNKVSASKIIFIYLSIR